MPHSPMDSDIFHTTPRRQYTVPGTEHRGSVASIHSTQSGNSFPTYGLIKVSNSDQGSSCDSFSLVSPQGSAYWNNNELRSSPRRTSFGAISQSKTLNPFHEDHYDENQKTPKTPLSAATATFGQPLSATAARFDQSIDHVDTETTTTGRSKLPLSRKLPFEDEAKGLKLPEHTFGRIRYILDRIITAYHSENGAFLNDRFFMNNEIFKQCSRGVPNGSVKIGIIQEITTLLKKFVEGDESSTSLGAVEATLHYYEKLMDAFDVFASPSDDSTRSDQESGGTSARSPRAPLDRTSSRGETPPSESQSQSQSQQNLQLQLQPQAQAQAKPELLSLETKIPQQTEKTTITNEKKKTNRGSFILLDKFKTNSRRRRSMLSLDQNVMQATSNPSLSQPLNNRQSKDQLLEKKHRSQPITKHSRSISVSTTASTRSMRDLCLLPEYMSLLEGLFHAIDDAYERFGPEPSRHAALERVIGFMDSHVIVFIMRDITHLTMALMKQMTEDYC